MSTISTCASAQKSRSLACPHPCRCPSSCWDACVVAQWVYGQTKKKHPPRLGNQAAVAEIDRHQRVRGDERHDCALPAGESHSHSHSSHTHTHACIQIVVLYPQPPPWTHASRAPLLGLAHASRATQRAVHLAPFSAAQTENCWPFTPGPPETDPMMDTKFGVDMGTIIALINAVASGEANLLPLPKQVALHASMRA